MSTRAIITFAANGGKASVYKHGDGYPSGVVATLANTLETIPGPPNAAHLFANEFMKTNGGKGGGYYRIYDADAWDAQYHYRVRALADLGLVVLEMTFGDSKYGTDGVALLAAWDRDGNRAVGTDALLGLLAA